VYDTYRKARLEIETREKKVLGERRVLDIINDLETAGLIDTWNISRGRQGYQKEIKINNTVIRRGDRVIIRKNNYELEVFNGDIGKVSHFTLDTVVVDIEDFYGESKRVDIPMRIADEMIKLAYCLTAHKSQGQEYTLVILAFVKAHGQFLLQRNLLYTALTRAKKKVVVIGQESAIESAIQNDKIQKRNTVFSERIKTWMNGGGISLRAMFSDYGSCQNARLLERLLSLEACE
jgi:exodeoxyribonuclease V alpha subunit